MPDAIFINPRLARGGRLVLGTRNPAARAWENWAPEKTRVRLETTDAGPVDVRCNVFRLPSHGFSVRARPVG
jgi:hypothetical protein